MKTFTILLQLTALAHAFATAQFPDKAIIDDESVDLFCNPLEQYFAKHPDARPNVGVACTALWRGYVATFKIERGEMSVADVEVLDPKSDNLKFVSVLDQTFPDPATRKMTWFTGLLVIPRGKEVENVHMGYASQYEAYRLIFVRNGDVRADRNFTGEEYREYRTRQFEEFKKTKRYQDSRARLEKAVPGLNPDGFLQIYEIDFASDLPLDYKDFVLNMSPAENPDPAKQGTRNE